jgi:hypothetical protein
LKRASASSNSDKDSNLQPPLQSPYPALVEPSPVESHNSHSTEATDIDEEAQNHQDDGQDEVKSPDIEIISPAVSHDPISPVYRTREHGPLLAVANMSKPSASLGRIDTSFANRLRSDSNDDAPPSVIHAPMGFRQFVGDPLDAQIASLAQNSQSFLRPQDNKRSPPQSSSQVRNRSVSAPSDKSNVSEATVVPSQTPENTESEEEKVGIPSGTTQAQVLTLVMQQRDSKEFTTPLNTQVPPIRHGAGSTPRASTKEEAEEERKRRRHSIRSNASNASVHDGKNTTPHVIKTGNEYR